MLIQQDFEELLALLEAHNVDYMIIGGYAVAFHGYPRFTKDIDIFYSTSTANIDKIIEVLVEFGFSSSDINRNFFTEPGTIVTFGVAPVRVDFLNQIDGMEYSEARQHRVRGTYGQIEVSFMGKADVIRNKRATSRTRDKADVEELT